MSLYLGVWCSKETSFNFFFHIFDRNLPFFSTWHIPCHIVTNGFTIALLQLFNCCLSQPSLPPLSWLSIFKFGGRSLEFIESFAQPFLHMTNAVKFYNTITICCPCEMTVVPFFVLFCFLPLFIFFGGFVQFFIFITQVTNTIVIPNSTIGFRVSITNHELITLLVILTSSPNPFGIL